MGCGLSCIFFYKKQPKLTVCGNNGVSYVRLVDRLRGYCIIKCLLFVKFVRCSVDHCMAASFYREKSVFAVQAHVFEIDQQTKKRWVPSSTSAIRVAYYHDTGRGTFRIIAIENSKVSLSVYTTLH